jgi:ankyrin repeat protein
MLPKDNLATKGVGINRGGWPERGQRPPIPGAKTPLLLATRAGDLKVTQLLVEHGADLELADANGVTPLLNAIVNASLASRADDGRTGHLATARYLIERGADVNAVDWYGQTPLWAAVNIRNLDVRGDGAATTDNKVDRAAALDLVKLLLTKGAQPNARIMEHPPERGFITTIGDLSWVDFTGETPFLRAALSGDLTTMKLLLAHGADPSITTFGGTNALMAAAGMNWVVKQTFDEGPGALLEAVKLAYDLGNDVNAVNTMGLTALHAAANRGSNDIIEFLAAKGAKLDVADVHGRTPTTWAEGVFLATHPPVSRPDTVALLERLEAGARQ